jgi:hypothetical protein
VVWFSSGLPVLLKHAYSEEWFRAKREMLKRYRKGEISRDDMVRQTEELNQQRPFSRPRSFEQAYYNVNYWSNKAKAERNRKLYRRKDKAIQQALGHLNESDIRPIRPKGHPGLLEIQIPKHRVTLHTYNPNIKKVLISRGYRIPTRRSPAERYLQEGKRRAQSRRSSQDTENSVDDRVANR